MTLKTNLQKRMYQMYLMSMDLTSASHQSDLRKELARQLLPRNIGEGVHHEFINCIVGKKLCFQTHSKCFPQ